MVSVIIPNFNHAPFLKERLRSVFEQTYPDFEVIILDDKSTDNSKEIIKEFENNPKVSHIITNDTNSGSPFVQWEKGIRYAKGDVIWIAESDDCCELDFLNNLVEMHESTDSILTFCHSMIIDNNNHIKENPFQDNLSKSFTMDGNLFVSKYLLNNNSIQNASSVLFSKAATKNAFKHNIKQFKCIGDWMFWIYIAQQGKVSYLKKPLNFYRKHDNCTSTISQLNGTSFKEYSILYRVLLQDGIINPKQYEAYRKSNIYMISEMKTSPLKKELYQLWKVGLLDYFHIALHNMKAKIIKYAKRFNKHHSSYF